MTSSTEPHAANTLHDIPSTLWLWVPLSVVAPAFAFGAYCKNNYPLWTPMWRVQVGWYEYWFSGESGILEIATAVILLIAVVMGVLCVKTFELEFRWVHRWLVLLLLATVYFAGEELSWGQHLIGWSTPNWFLEATGNRQQETNLHNISGWLNQKPRHLFLLWVLVGGIVVPLKRRLTRRPSSPGKDWRYWFWPTWVCTLTAVLAILVKSPEWAATILGIKDSSPVLWRIYLASPSETQEFCLAVFLLLYFSSVYRRLLALRN